MGGGSGKEEGDTSAVLEADENGPEVTSCAQILVQGLIEPKNCEKCMRALNESHDKRLEWENLNVKQWHKDSVMGGSDYTENLQAMTQNMQVMLENAETRFKVSQACTFDQGPDAKWSHGAQLMNTAGGRGCAASVVSGMIDSDTKTISGSLLRNTGELKAVINAASEVIGGHFGHRFK